MDDIKFNFKACNPPGCGCPDVEYDNGVITIKDDFGGLVKLPLPELQFIVDKTNSLIENIKTDLEKQQADMDALIAQKTAEREAMLSRKNA